MCQYILPSASVAWFFETIVSVLRRFIPGLSGEAGEQPGRNGGTKEGEKPQPGAGCLLLHHHPIPSNAWVSPCSLPRDSTSSQSQSRMLGTWNFHENNYSPDLPTDRVPWPGRGMLEGCHPADRPDPGLPGGEAACRDVALPALHPPCCA